MLTLAVLLAAIATTQVPAPAVRTTCREWAALPHTACYAATPRRPCAPGQMPTSLRRAFTLDGAMETSKTMVVDDTMGGVGTHFETNGAGLARMVAAADGARRDAVRAYGRGELAADVAAHRQRLFLAALDATAEAFPALVGRAARAVVFGSMSPWIEAHLVALGVGSVTTVEYNGLTYEHERVGVVTVAELAEAAGAGVLEPFDLAVSLSAFDHDGLGRYGDPISPHADLNMVRALADCILAPHGRLILSVPVGADQLVWNMHRRYGPARLPLLLAPFALGLGADSDAVALVDAASVFGWDSDARLDATPPFTRSFEPVFVLRTRTRAPGAHADL